MGFSAREDRIKQGVDTYMIKSFSEVRSILLTLPNKYPMDTMRKTGTTMFAIWATMVTTLRRYVYFVYWLFILPKLK
jgi:hypothetical protein